MITSLSIKNYALIDSLDISFGKGFTAITGETGAGKSILLGALGLVLGNRADLSVLRNKNAKCIVEAVFDLSALDMENFFTVNDLDFDIVTVLRREILPSGKSRAFINDTPVSLQQMKSLGNRLVDIHSQHETLLLGKSDFQRSLFDGFINNPEAFKDYRHVYSQYVELKNETGKLQKQKEENEREQDFIRFQYEELESVAGTLADFEELKEEEQILRHAEEIATGLGTALSFLSENSPSALEYLGHAKETLSSLSKFHPLSEQLANRLESVIIELKDIVSELEKAGSNVVYNRVRADELNQMLDSVYRLQQKHRVNTPEELLKLKDSLLQRLNVIENIDALLAEKKVEFDKIKKELENKAGLLSKLRNENKKKFENAVQMLLKQLGMPHAQLTVKIEQAEDFSEHGADNLYFLFNANRGGIPLEIAKTASGGELSRLMLALKAMVQQSRLLPTIVFDEIDSGVSGRIAGKIGDVLKEMSQKLQIIAITHLPQIAAKADFHLKVYKQTDDTGTVTTLTQLTGNERLNEIASLISDKKITPAAMEAAKDLLEARK